MEILNVGPLELIIILALMFIVLGPKDMVKTAQRIGRWVRSVTHSQMWREVWGISQDIRELPKKLMEDTGLEEALTDVKQTTQEVASELNAQINEVKEAARVPEVEHIRIENPLTTPPPPGTVPAALSSAAEQAPGAELSTVETPPAVSETSAGAVEAAADGTPAEDLQPAVLEVAEPALVEPAVTKKPRRKKPVDTGEQVEVVEPVKKPRRKKQVAAAEQPAAIDQQTAAGQPVGVESFPLETAAEADLPRPLAQPEVQAPAEESSNGSTSEAAAPVEPVKKPRRKKQSPPAEETMETTAPVAASAEPAPAVDAATAPTVPPELVPEPAPQKRSARTRKTVEHKDSPVSTMPIVAGEEPVAAAPTNGQPGKNGTEMETPPQPQPLPRKRRTSRSAAIAQTEPADQSDQDAA